MRNKPRALVLASVASMIDQFNMDNIDILLHMGCEVDVIANFREPGTISRARASECRKKLQSKGVRVCNIEIPRSIRRVRDIVASYQMIGKICEHRNYDLIHCQSPIGGVIARLAARKTRENGCTVIYTAHGFHFYDGAPMLNWMLFYPIEKYCSKYTDVLVTINEEDYRIARNRFYAKSVARIPGVGVNTELYKPVSDPMSNAKKRREIHVPEDAVMILSVGELNDNKNQQLIIRTIGQMHDERIHYVIAGVGDGKEELERLASELHIDANVHLLGYRTDIPDLDNCADIFAFPSKREGLGMASLEALACGTPVVGMNIRGIREYVIPGKTGELFDDNPDSCQKAISDVIGKKNEMQRDCIETAQKFSLCRTKSIMEHIYKEALS